MHYKDWIPMHALTSRISSFLPSLSTTDGSIPRTKIIKLGLFTLSAGGVPDRYKPNSAEEGCYVPHTPSSFQGWCTVLFQLATHFITIPNVTTTIWCQTKTKQKFTDGTSNQISPDTKNLKGVVTSVHNNSFFIWKKKINHFVTSWQRWM